MAEVFLSYTRHDEKIARLVVDALEGFGLSVWWDHKLTPKAHWDRLIESEINAADAVLVLWSPDSIGSDWVRAEANYAIENDKLVQARLGACKPPLLFAMRQYADLSAWAGDAGAGELLRLANWIALLLERKRGTADARLDLIRARWEAAGAPSKEAASRPSPSVSPASEVTEATARAGTMFRDAPWAPLLAVIPPGRFEMGDLAGDGAPGERPAHEVAIPRPFAIGVYPVTFLEWDLAVNAGFLRYSPLDMGWGRADRPVIHVSWDDCHAYLGWLSTETGQAYRLPTEAEWEYACRAGSRTRYSGGDVLERSGGGRSVLRRTSPVGGASPNAFGLYDMHGNVWEWVADVWHPGFAGAPADGSAWTEGGEQSARVIRGGAWGFSEHWLRSSVREQSGRGTRAHTIGFRVARDI